MRVHLARGRTRIVSENEENLLLIRDRRVAVSYVVEALALFDHYHFRVAQQDAQKAKKPSKYNFRFLHGNSGRKSGSYTWTGTKKELVLSKPPRTAGEEAWWAEDYTDARKIRDRELFA